LEAQAIEEPLPDDAPIDDKTVRPLPEPTRTAEVEAWRGEVRTAAIAAAGGIVAGAATVAAVRAVRGGNQSRGGILRRKDRRKQGIVASRSFLIDVHVLGR
jgi:hypothetical protein